MVTGAWAFGGYRQGMEGTLGESLLSDSDNLGWAIRAWKYELAFNGYRGRMLLDLPVFGGAMRDQVQQYQGNQALTVDGVVGPLTGRTLLHKRIQALAVAYRVPVTVLTGIVAHESGFDLGAVGSVDQGDRGAAQQHLVAGGPVDLSQAIRPAHALPTLAAQMQRLTAEWDVQAAVASWNIGEGGAEWWWRNGEPKTGSPAFWTDGDVSARATAYVTAVFVDGTASAY